LLTMMPAVCVILLLGLVSRTGHFSKGDKHG
jgi:hypothetical protein